MRLQFTGAGLSMLALASCGSEATPASMTTPAVTEASSDFPKDYPMYMEACVGEERLSLSFTATVNVQGNLKFTDRTDPNWPREIDLIPKIEDQIQMIEDSTQQRLSNRASSMLAGADGAAPEETPETFIKREWYLAEKDFSEYALKVDPKNITFAEMELKYPTGEGFTLKPDPTCAPLEPAR